MLRDRPWAQQSLALLTVPSGSGGASAFSAGLPTYLGVYALAVPVGSAVGLSFTQALTYGAGTDANGVLRRTWLVSPALTASVTLSPAMTMLVQDQLTLPTSLGATTANRALIGLQAATGPNVLVDLGYEINALPIGAARQNAISGGITVRLR